MSQSLKITWIQDRDPSQLEGYYVWVRNPHETVYPGTTPHDYVVTPLQKTGVTFTPREVSFNLREVPDGNTTVVVAELDAYGRWKWVYRSDGFYVNQGGDISSLPFSSLNPNGATTNLSVSHDGSVSDTVIDCRKDVMGTEYLVAIYVDPSTGAVGDSQRTLYGFTGDWSNPVNDPHEFTGAGWPHVKVLGTPILSSKVTANVTVAPDNTLRINGYPIYQNSADTDWKPTGIDAPAWHVFDCAGNYHNTDYVEFNPDDIDGDLVLNECDAHHPDNIGLADSDGDGILDICDLVFDPPVPNNPLTPDIQYSPNAPVTPLIEHSPAEVTTVTVGAQPLPVNTPVVQHSPNPLVTNRGAYRVIQGQQVYLPEVLTFTNLGSSTTGATQHLNNVVLTLGTSNAWESASTYAHQVSSPTDIRQLKIKMIVDYNTTNSEWEFVLYYPKYEDSTWNRRANQTTIILSNLSDLWNTTNWSGQPSQNGRDLEISIAESYTSAGDNPVISHSPNAVSSVTSEFTPNAVSQITASNSPAAVGSISLSKSPDAVSQVTLSSSPNAASQVTSDKSPDAPTSTTAVLPKPNAPAQVTAGYIPNSVSSVDVAMTLATLNSSDTIALGTSTSYFTRNINNDKVYAAGSNAAGNLGPGALDDDYDKYSEIVNSSGSIEYDVLEVSSLNRHTIFRRDGGTVWGLGENLYGQLGTGSRLAEGELTQAKWSGGSNVSGAISVSAGEDFSAFVLYDGTVWTMGRNTYGQLGNNSTTDSTVPVQVVDSTGTAITGVSSVHCGRDWCFAIKLDKTILSWGRNNYKQLGQGITATQLNYAAPAKNQSGTALTNIVKVATSWDHVLALTSTGDVYGTGNGYSGSLGTQSNWGVQGSSHGYFQRPSETYQSGFMSRDTWSSAALTGVTDICAGGKMNSTYTIFIKNNGTEIWGMGKQGNWFSNRLTTPRTIVGTSSSTLEKPWPERMITVSSDLYTEVHAGDTHIFARRNSGVVECAGDNTSGELGLGHFNIHHGIGGGYNTRAFRLSGGLRSGLTGVEKTYSGGSCNFIHFSSGLLQGAGRNNFGQLGIGSTTDALSRTDMILDSNNQPLSGVSKISSSGNHTLVLFTNGTLGFSGLTSSGQNGEGVANTTTNVTKVKMLTAHSGVHDILACKDTSYIIKGTSREGWAWGSSLDGVLGGNSNFSGNVSNLPQQMKYSNGTHVTNISQIAATEAGAVAVLVNGKVYTSGRNNLKQLGRATNLSNQTYDYGLDAVKDSTGADLSNIVNIWAHWHGFLMEQQGGNFYTTSSLIPYHQQTGLTDPTTGFSLGATPWQNEYAVLANSILGGYTTQDFLTSAEYAEYTAGNGKIFVQDGTIFKTVGGKLWAKGINFYGALGTENTWVKRNASGYSSVTDHGEFAYDWIQADIRYNFNINNPVGGHGSVGANRTDGEVQFPNNVAHISGNDRFTSVTLDTGRVYSFGVNLYGAFSTGSVDLWVPQSNTGQPAGYYMISGYTTVKTDAFSEQWNYVTQDAAVATMMPE